jgi:hypothetical protein
MNTVSIAPQLILNVLQNMNTKRDTLEKRAFIKNQFPETTMISNNTDNNTRIETANGGGGSTGQSNNPPPEYMPSLEEQYLPKTLRGTNSNPYHIMNAMSENVTNAPAAPIASSNTIEPTTASSTTLEVTMIPETKKEVIIPSVIDSTSSEPVGI